MYLVYFLREISAEATEALIEDVVDEKLPYHANQDHSSAPLIRKFDGVDKWLPTCFLWPLAWLLILRDQVVQ